MNVTYLAARVVSACLLSMLLMLQVPGTQAAGVAALPRQQVLYQANWAHGLVGWRQAGNEWQITAQGLHGVCVFSEQTNQGILTIPYALGHRQRFAVQMRFRVDTLDGGTGASFSLLARTSQQPNSSVGVHAGAAYYEGAAGPLWSAELWYGGTNGDPLSAAPGALPATISLDQDTFNPGHAWHTYRLEVRGRSYTLFIDGVQELSARTTQALFVPNPYLAITGDAGSYRISQLQILSLP